MSTLDPYWSAYLALQKAAANSTNICISLALEGALTALLKRAEITAATSAADINSEIDRSINTFACRERGRARVRIRHHNEIELDVAYEGSLVAAVLTNEIRELISEEDWEVVLAIAMGWSYKELARSDISPAALRVRVSRVREHLRRAA